MVRAFSPAPIDAGGTMNPDGQFRITLHVDTGALNDQALLARTGPPQTVSGCASGGASRAFLR
jgi:hypothetical protein